MLEYCSVNIADMSTHHEHALVNGVLEAQVDALAMLVDLCNATHAANVVFENRRRVVEEFSELWEPNDTGRTEVQGVSFVLRPRGHGDYIGATHTADTQDVEPSGRV